MGGMLGSGQEEVHKDTERLLTGLGVLKLPYCFPPLMSIAVSHQPTPLSDKWLIREGVEAKYPEMQTSCHLVLGRGLGFGDIITEYYSSSRPEPQMIPRYPLQGRH